MYSNHAEYEEFEQNAKNIPRVCDKNIIIEYLYDNLNPQVVKEKN